MYRVLGTVLYLYNSFFLFSCTLFPTVWWWGIYFIDCDVIVIDSVWFAFVSVLTRSWARVSGGPRNIWFWSLGFPPPKITAFAFSEPALVGVQEALGWKNVIAWRRHTKTMLAEE